MGCASAGVENTLASRPAITGIAAGSKASRSDSFTDTVRTAKFAAPKVPTGRVTPCHTPDFTSGLIGSVRRRVSARYVATQIAELRTQT